ncbi:MAG: molecular chaperone TorD family protein [Chloroflexi bacterium]|nr:molecular chaperone TorD family protein [Chloroflexota bacterium]
MKQYLERLAATADICGLLSLCYASPADEAFNDELPARLTRALRAAGFLHIEDEAARMSRCFGDSKDDLDLKLEYTRLFRGPVKAAAYPYESMNVEGEVMAKSTLSVLDCYREVGVAVSESFNDLPDHITVELEFVRYLCLKEMAAIKGGNVEDACPSGKPATPSPGTIF